jgi:hypothetical protein
MKLWDKLLFLFIKKKVESIGSLMREISALIQPLPDLRECRI